MTPTEQQVEVVARALASDRGYTINSFDHVSPKSIIGRCIHDAEVAVRAFAATPAQVPEGEVVHTPEVERIIEATERMAHRCGARFVPDPDRIAAFMARSPTAAPAEDGEVERDWWSDQVNALLARATAAEARVAEEREACAQVAEQKSPDMDGIYSVWPDGPDIAVAIRARKD